MTIDGLFLRVSLLVLAVLTTVALCGPLGCDGDRQGVAQRIEASPERTQLEQLDDDVVEPAELDVEPTEPDAESISEPERREHDERVRWCEPLDQPFCSTASDCPGRQLCVRPWWARIDGTKVCALAYPTKAEQRARVAELEVLVDDLCQPGRCDRGDLLALLRALGSRESSLRPDKRHRLDADREAALEAWREQAETYAGNAAYANSDRWSTGLGLYGQNPALWLRRWDPMAPPETLCGLVESSVVLLRRAREHVLTLQGRGIVCGGEPYHGSACTEGRCGPSWYDVALVNSGNNCPSARSFEDFEPRARSLGLDPLGPVTAGSLGRTVPVEGQDAWADAIRVRMRPVI